MDQSALIEVVMVYDGVLLESVEGLGDPPVVARSGEIWHRLQDEKAEVAQNLLDEGALVHDQVNAGPEADFSDEIPRELEWLHRALLCHPRREFHSVCRRADTADAAGDVSS